MKEGKTLKYDFSLPIETFDEFVQQVRTKAGQEAKTGGYGHIGDGNLHVRLFHMNNIDKCIDQRI